MTTPAQAGPAPDPQERKDLVLIRAEGISKILRSWGVDESKVNYDHEGVGVGMGRSWLIVHFLDAYKQLEADLAAVRAQLEEHGQHWQTAENDLALEQALRQQAEVALTELRAKLGNEHAGGSLNGPSRLGASPNTDTGGECVLVPRSLVVKMVNLCDVTKLGLHGTPWAQSELSALYAALRARLALPLQAQEPEK